MPKTGTSFVRDCLKRIHQKKWYQFWRNRNGYKELMLPKVYADYEPYKSIVDQHGTYIQIPEKFKHREIVSIVRNPFEKIISVYEFGFWKEHPIYDEEIIREVFPAYPNLNFSQFVDFYHDFWVRFLVGEKAKHLSIGPQTLLHIKFYGKRPDTIIKEFTNVESLLDEQHFAGVKFFRTKCLNEDLYAFLKAKNYSEQTIRFIKDAKPLNTSKRSTRKYITSEIRAKILHKERLLFDAFPEYRKTYQC